MERSHRVFAATPVLHRRRQPVAFAPEDPAVELHTGECGQLARLIRLSQFPVPGVAYDVLPHAFRVVDDDRVCELQRFVGQKAGVIAAHHHRNAAATIRAGNLIRPPCGVGLHRQRDEVGLVIRGNLFQSLVEEIDCDVLWRQPRQHREGQGLHRVVGAPAHDAGTDECNFHRCNSLSLIVARVRSRPWRELPVAGIELVEVVRVEAIAEIGGDRNRHPGARPEYAPGDR